MSEHFSGGAFGASVGDAWAPFYDEFSELLTEESPEIRVIAELTPPGGRILEYGVGTGRVAAPLSSLGYHVTGIDVSSEMLRLLAGRHLEGVDFIQQSFTEPVAGQFDTVIALFNTLLYVPTQEEQTLAFTNAAEALEPGGAFLIEVGAPFGPILTGPHLATSSPYSVGGEKVHALHTIHDPVTQTMRMTHSIISPDSVVLLPSDCRYLWPSEMRLMARLAGLAVESVRGDWLGSSMTLYSSRYIGTFRKACTEVSPSPFFPRGDAE